MRTVRRLDASPPTLAEPDGKGWRAHEANRRGADDDRRFPAHWLQPDVQGVLYAFQGRVCGYCGAHLGANDAGDVEHFRPKAKLTDDPTHPGYWWLAYALDNYIFSCRVCNSSRKGNRFPLSDGATRCDAPAGDLAAEARILFHPAEDDLDEACSILIEQVCQVAPRQTADAARVDAVIDFFDLNRADLCRDRLDIRDEVVDAIASGDLDRARRLASRYAPHSLVAAAVLVGAGEALPTPAEELEALLALLLRQLDTAQQLAVLETDADLQKKRAAEVEEAAWALAAVWKDPPTGDPALIEAFLDDNGIADLVRDLRDQL